MRYAVPFSITSQLPNHLGRIPISADIDFAELIQRVEGQGRLDPSTIEVIDSADGTVVRHGLSEDLSHGDYGRIEFAIQNVTHCDYEIHFDTLLPGELRRHLAPTQVPMVGAGDLLRGTGHPGPEPSWPGIGALPKARLRAAGARPPPPHLA